jgi:ABC-type dipeptide/oligopeptide/nickel transport system permease component
MLRYVLRRAFWVVPSILMVSLVGFWVLSALPQASDKEGSHLPLFFNSSPRDITVWVEHAVGRLRDARGDHAARQQAMAELGGLGGAALPLILPRLDSLAPELRRDVLTALAPVAERMGVRNGKQAASQQSALLFWTLFWQTQDIEFRRASADSAVRRYARYGTDARAQHVRLLDTYALDSIFSFLMTEGPNGQLAEKERLLQVLSAILGTELATTVCKSPNDATACIVSWLHWWRVRRWRYVRIAGGDKLLAMATATRYGLWVLDTVALEFDGNKRTGRAREFLVCGARTLGLVLAAVVVSSGLALFLALLMALRQGGWTDRLMQFALLSLYVVSPVFLGWLLMGEIRSERSGLAAAVAVLSAGMLLLPTRQLQLGLQREFKRDYWLAARARGMGQFAAAWRHAMRHAVLPVASRGLLQLPWMLCGAFVVERLFSLPGLAAPTLRAVRDGDVAWLMLLATTGAVVALLTHALGDGLQGWLDPRLREAFVRTRRNSV